MEQCRLGSRREFLYSMVLNAGLLASCSSIVKESRSDSKCCVFGFNDSKGGGVGIIDFESDSISKVTLPFENPHEILRSPLNKDLIFVLQKKGPFVSTVSLSQKKLLSFTKRKDNLYFYGHGQLYGDQFLVSTAYDQSSFKGHLSYLDAKTMKEVNRVETYGFLPHQVKLYGDHQAFVSNVASKKGGHAGSLSIVNLKNGALIKKYESDRKYFFHHFSVDLKNQSVLVATSKQKKKPGRPNPDSPFLIWNFKTDQTRFVDQKERVTNYIDDTVLRITQDQYLISSHTNKVLNLVSHSRQGVVDTKVLPVGFHGIVKAANGRIFGQASGGDIYEIIIANQKINSAQLFWTHNRAIGRLDIQAHMYYL